MQYLKQLTVSLHDLAMNFHSLMIETEAKYFTVNGYSYHFWYITDVRPDGTYPCHPTDDKGNAYYPMYIDYTEQVTIHFKTLQP